MQDYEKDFFSDDETVKRGAVKRLTQAAEFEMRKMTVNSPDW
jgi:hypothetical protein